MSGVRNSWLTLEKNCVFARGVPFCQHLKRMNLEARNLDLVALSELQIQRRIIGAESRTQVCIAG